MLIYFSAREPDNSFKKFRLSDEEYIVLGRGSSAIVTLSDELTSSTHCKIYIKDQKVYVEDLSSKNGTSINGVKVNKQRVYLDDIIQLGQTYISVDIAKLSEEDKALLTYKGKRKNQDRSLTLELETHKRSQSKIQKNHSTQKQKDYVKNSKLFKDSINHKVQNKSQSQALTKLSLLIDLVLAFLVFSITVYSSKFMETEVWEKSEFSLNFIINDLIFYSSVGLLLAVVFFRVTRNLDGGSIGDRILKL